MSDGVREREGARSRGADSSRLGESGLLRALRQVCAITAALRGVRPACTDPRTHARAPDRALRSLL